MLCNKHVFNRFFEKLKCYILNSIWNIRIKDNGYLSFYNMKGNEMSTQVPAQKIVMYTIKA